MIKIEIFLIILLVLVLIVVSVGFAVYALNNTKYSYELGTCKKDPKGSFTSKSACQTYCKPVYSCKPGNFIPDCSKAVNEQDCNSNYPLPCMANAVGPSGRVLGNVNQIFYQKAYLIFQITLVHRCR